MSVNVGFTKAHRCYEDRYLFRAEVRRAKGKEKDAEMIIIDYTDRRPIYEQIVERFQSLVLCGVLEKDAPLPSVRNLAMELSINPNTIQRAYGELERRGVIYTVKGKGNFVADMQPLLALREKEVKAEAERLVHKAKEAGMTREELERLLDAAWTASTGTMAEPAQTDEKKPEGKASVQTAASEQGVGGEADD